MGCRFQDTGHQHQHRDGAIVGAGAVVTKHVLADAVVAGVPAKIIRMTGFDSSRGTGHRTSHGT